MHQQASQQYWPGHSSSTPATAAQSTLPTPPSDGADGFKPPSHNLKSRYNGLAAPQAQQQAGMASSLDTTAASSSLTARRPAATMLPQFELPQPQFQHYNGGQTQKYIPLPAMNATQTSAVSAGNLLTPPSTVPSDSLPLSSALNGATAAHNLSSSSYNNTYAWPPLNTGLTPTLGLSTGTGTTPQAWANPPGQVRGMFSPSLASSLGGRVNSHSPTAGESLPPPPWNMNGNLNGVQNGLPPLPLSMPASGTLGSLNAQQSPLAQAYLTQNQIQTQTPTPVSTTTTQASPMSGTDPYAQRPHSTPSALYSQSQPTSAQQTSFPPFNNNSSPTQHSPMSAPARISGQSPFSAQNSFSPAPPPNPFGRPSIPPSYSVGYSPMPPMAAPQVSGPIMTNMYNPNSPMGLLGMQNGVPGGSLPYGFHSGNAASVAQAVGGYGNPQQMGHTERPFKCDQCPQSFNRNHDLKRHKRIHLAVKPFPCGHCDKSFSRKDALKRHILVKGCGKGGAPERQSGSPDTPTKSEGSESSQSPVLDQNS